MMKARLLLALSVAVMSASFLQMTSLSHFTRQAYDYLGLLTLAFAGYLGTLYAARKLEIRFYWIIIIALLLRIPLLFTSPTLSADVYRYVWDGRLITHGISPYAYHVDAPELAFLRTDWHAQIDHQWMASPYPPIAGLVFAITYTLFPESHTAMQFAMMLFDVVTIILIGSLLKHYGRSAKWSLIYAWHPVMVVEFAHGAHIDSLMTLLVLAALIASLKQKQRLSAVLLGLATLTKFMPILLLPTLLQQWRWRTSLYYGAVVTVGVLPFIIIDGLASNGTGIFGATTIYAQQWKTNDGLFYWLVEFLAGYTSDASQFGKIISNGALLSLGGLIFLRPRLDPVVASLLLISAYLLLTPAMFPWYLTWLIALLPLWRVQYSSLFVRAWLYFSWAVNLSYLFYIDPATPGEIVWVRYIEYLPLYAALSLAALGYGVTLLKFLPERHQQNHNTPQYKQAGEKGNRPIPSIDG